MDNETDYIAESERTRAAARIDRVRFGVEPDHGLHVAELTLVGREGGWGQGFQMCLKPEHVEMVRRELCALFGVATGDELVGQDCFALRSFPGYGAVIVGVEAPNGRRFTRAGFARRHGYKMSNELEHERRSLKLEVESAERHWRDARARLEAVGRGYVEWDC